MNIDEIKQILENAPEGATHVDSYKGYWKIKRKFNYVNWDSDCETWGDFDILEDALSSLSDLKQILALHERVEELESSLRKTALELGSMIDMKNKDLENSVSSSDLDDPDYFDHQTVYEAMQLLKRNLTNEIMFFRNS